MSIRYYLLLIAGLTTTLVFLGSFFLETYLLDRSLQTAGKASQELYEKMFIKRKEYLEEFIQDSLAKQLAQINSLLSAISRYKPLAEWFSPTQEHRQQGTWVSATSLMQQDEWIQFLQNSTGEEVMSLVTPDKGPFLPVETIPIEEGLSWVYVVDGQSTRPFLGIQVHNRMFADRGEEGGLSTLGILPCVQVLYDVDRLRTFTPIRSGEEDALSYVPIPFAQGVEIDEMQFLSDLERALTIVSSPNFSIPESTVKKTPVVAVPVEGSPFQTEVQRFLQERTSYSSELFLLWESAVLQQVGALGSPPLWPDGMTFSSEGMVYGEVFFLRSVMDFSGKLFDDDTFYDAHPPADKNSFVSSGSCIVKGVKKNQVFLGNTAALFEGQEGEASKRSLLTLGVDLQELLSDLVTTSNCYGIIVSGGEFLSIQSPSDKSVMKQEDLAPLLTKDAKQLEGVLSLATGEYHFFHIQPIPEVDLHFFLLNLKQDAFDFSYNFQVFQEQVQQILEKLEIDRRFLEGLGVIVLWLLLLRLSKKITKPIIGLSSALIHVQKGEWDQIQFPNSQFQKKNEIKILCDSFKDMVEGMKEKEKVEGILNKVVSPEIAKEILKGEVVLGGEEKVVTMLFADIRGFTSLTQTMDPQEVVRLLNQCMTKLSAIIEEHKGVLDKYLGDGLMALYGAPISYEDSALYALESGLHMLDAAREWNEQRKQEGLPLIDIGIGVHTGTVCAGNMGAQNRLNYTVIGSSVNMASRLCSAAEAGELLITEETYRQPLVQGKMQIVDKGLLSFKGFDEKKRVFQVTGRYS